MEEIEEELLKISKNHNNEEEGDNRVIEKPKRKGQSRERMLELHKIRSEKADQKRKEKEELKAKEEEIERIKKEKIEFEYEEAKKIKEAIDRKRNPKVIKEKVIKEIPIEKKDLYNEASRDLLRDKFLEEAKRRVMADLFS